MLQKILKDKYPNELLTFGCFNNVMPTNVIYVIKASSITTLDDGMEKENVMEENMLESNVDLVLILGMTSLSMNPL